MHCKEYKHILSPQNGMNIYRGCTHGCIYCDSRSKCYQMRHDFEDIKIKTNAPEILERELRKKRRLCMVGTGAMTDPYIPEETEIGHTRRCLEIIEKYGFGLAVQTKSKLILRDLDLLKSINNKAKCVVQITLTTYDESLCKILEPKVCTTKERVETLKLMRDNGIPTVVWLCPLLPFINDTEENILGILRYCADAGVWGILNFGIGLTLRDGNREYFYAALDKHFPGLKEKYALKYGSSYEIRSDNSGPLMRIFSDFCSRHGIVRNVDEIFRFMREFPEKSEQTGLF
ncbi:MAG: radical SAM protein [Oscillospiraceae bacterium]|nr:radical SAM protein [Oscillospiraceae bacterium]